MKNYINLGFMEDSEVWCKSWCLSLGCNASVEDAQIMAAICQYYFREEISK